MHTDQTKEALLQAIQALDISQAAWVLPETIPFSPAVRAACKQNACGKYGKTWSCPPGCGELEQIRAQLAPYQNAIVFNTVSALEDSYDFEGMQAAALAHGKLTAQAAKTVGAFLSENNLPAQVRALSAGSCTLCAACTYPDAPCRLPGQALVSMEAAGIDVARLSGLTGLRYINGANTVTYFSLLMF